MKEEQKKRNAQVVLEHIKKQNPTLEKIAMDTQGEFMVTLTLRLPQSACSSAVLQEGRVLEMSDKAS